MDVEHDNPRKQKINKDHESRNLMTERCDYMKNQANERYGKQKSQMYAESIGSKGLEIEKSDDLMSQMSARYESLKNQTSRGRDDMKEQSIVKRT